MSDKIIFYNGNVYSGKTLVLLEMERRRFRRKKSIVFWHNIFHPFNKWHKPIEVKIWDL